MEEHYNTRPAWEAIRSQNKDSFDLLDLETEQFGDDEKVGFALQLLKEALDRSVTLTEFNDVFSWILHVEVVFAPVYIEWLDIVVRFASRGKFKYAFSNGLRMNDFDFEDKVAYILDLAYHLNQDRLRNVIQWLGELYDQEAILWIYVDRLRRGRLQPKELSILARILDVYNLSLNPDEVTNESIREWLLNSDV
jgi:hypothetical protein